jgi:hypothetical protein
MRDAETQDRDLSNFIASFETGDKAWAIPSLSTQLTIGRFSFLRLDSKTRISGNARADMSYAGA